MVSESPLTPVIGRVASVVETMQPVFAALGGGAALGSILHLRGSFNGMIRSSTMPRRPDRSGAR
jgi:hypothetical protein